MTIELTEDEVEFIIKALFLTWRIAIDRENIDKASLLGGKLQLVLKEEKERNL